MIDKYIILPYFSVDRTQILPRTLVYFLSSLVGDHQQHRESNDGVASGFLAYEHLPEVLAIVASRLTVSQVLWEGHLCLVFLKKKMMQSRVYYYRTSSLCSMDETVDSVPLNLDGFSSSLSRFVVSPSAWWLSVEWWRQPPIILPREWWKNHSVSMN